MVTITPKILALENEYRRSVGLPPRGGAAYDAAPAPETSEKDYSAAKNLLKCLEEMDTPSINKAIAAVVACMSTPMTEERIADLMKALGQKTETSTASDTPDSSEDPPANAITSAMDGAATDFAKRFPSAARIGADPTPAAPLFRKKK